MILTGFKPNPDRFEGAYTTPATLLCPSALQSVSVARAVKFEDILGFYTNSTYGMDISGAPTGERAEKLGNYLINDNYSPCVLNAKRMRAPTETVIFADSQSAFEGPGFSHFGFRFNEPPLPKRIPAVPPLRSRTAMPGWHPAENCSNPPIISSTGTIPG